MRMFFLLLISGFLVAQEKAFIEMPAIFSDNMVLQQSTEAPFWGKALPGKEVNISTSWGASAKTIVGQDSMWKTKVNTPKAGGPYTVKIQIGESVINYNNVLSGEVWVCSGQSNMEMPLEGWPPNDTISFSSTEISNAVYPNIRFFTVTKAISLQPEFNCDGKWVECSPVTAAKFSATAFFFGKKINKELNVPVGLINTSWGGTPAEAWTSPRGLEQFPEYKNYFTNIEESIRTYEQLKLWLNSMPQKEVSPFAEEKWKNIDFNDAGCQDENYNDVDWKEIVLPNLWEGTDVGNLDGVVWFRKKVEIPESFVNKDLVLELGPIDDMDISFVNGTKVGGYEIDGHWQTPRVYSIPANLVQSKILTIAVRVMDTQGGGGIYGLPEHLNIHLKDGIEKISLAGSWKYGVVAEYGNGRFYVLDISKNTYLFRPKPRVEISAYSPTTLYNGMISPLIPYAIRGAIWYQGEANVGRAEQYKSLFPAMINNWRNDWQQGNFPFYYTQIAPYTYGIGSESQKVREAQMLSLSVPNSGMAVTMDIATVNNIHPPDKKNVGERLALWALAKNYNKKIVFSGPIYKSMKIDKDKIVLDFDYAESGLLIKEKNGESNITIAGVDSIFKKAVYEIKGSKIIVYNNEIKNPVAVRYAWSDTAEGTIFNKDGLPASSFRTDNWQK